MAISCFSMDEDPLPASDDDSCLNCGHHELDHLQLEENEVPIEVFEEWDGRCLVEKCPCKRYK